MTRHSTHAAASLRLYQSQRSPVQLPPHSPSSALDGDAKLLELGRQWEAVQAKRRANDAVFAALSEAEKMANAAADQSRADILFNRAYALFDEILGMPAHTIEGIKLKAHIVADECEIDGRGEAAVDLALQAPRSYVEQATLSLGLGRPQVLEDDGVSGLIYEKTSEPSCSSIAIRPSLRFIHVACCRFRGHRDWVFS